jgi:hypothetical protein
MKKRGLVLFGLSVALQALLLTGCPGINNGGGAGNDPPVMPPELLGIWTQDTMSFTFTGTDWRFENSSDNITWYEAELLDTGVITLTEGDAYDAGYTKGYALLTRCTALGAGAAAYYTVGDLIQENLYLHNDGGTLTLQTGSGYDLNIWTKEAE